MLKIKEIEKHQSCVNYKNETVGSASIAHVVYKPGYYRMEGVDGYDLYNLISPTKITNLRVGGKTVMVDDPLHCIGMQRIAETAFGSVFVAGLGLGIVTKYLLKNRNVHEISVHEINEDVISLIGKHFDNERLQIVNSDALISWRGYMYSTYIFDLSVYHGGESSLVQIESQLKAAYKIKQTRPFSRVYIWGLRGTEFDLCTPQGPEAARLDILQGVKVKSV